MVVPRTFDPQFLDWSPVPGRAGFVGTLDHLPNEEGIRRVLETLESQEIPSSVDLRIVGGPEATGRELERTFPAVTYCGRLSQEDFKAEAATWGLFLNPIWWYARGATTKLAQGISWGIPVVTTTPGMRGYAWTKGEVKVTDTPEEMAQVIVDAAEEPSVLSGWAEDVRTVARNGPTIDQVASKLKGHLRPLVENIGCSES
jgi:glycosyltransferase involved in cell wall biosynthesis